jgi:hypothetical protein
MYDSQQQGCNVTAVGMEGSGFVPVGSFIEPRVVPYRLLTTRQRGKRRQPNGSEACFEKSSFPAVIHRLIVSISVLAPPWPLWFVWALAAKCRLVAMLGLLTHYMGI